MDIATQEKGTTMKKSGKKDNWKKAIMNTFYPERYKMFQELEKAFSVEEKNRRAPAVSKPSKACCHGKENMGEPWESHTVHRHSRKRSTEQAGNYNTPVEKRLSVEIAGDFVDARMSMVAPSAPPLELLQECQQDNIPLLTEDNFPRHRCQQTKESLWTVDENIWPMVTPPPSPTTLPPSPPPERNILIISLMEKLKECPICRENFLPGVRFVHQCICGYHYFWSECDGKLEKRTCPECRETLPKKGIRNQFANDFLIMMNKQETLYCM